MENSKYLSMKEIDEIEMVLKETLGKEEMLESIELALDYDTKQDIYLFIARMHDIEIGE